MWESSAPSPAQAEFVRVFGPVLEHPLRSGEPTAAARPFSPSRTWRVLLFSFLDGRHFRPQGNSGIPTGVFSTTPFVLVLVVLALAGSRGQQGNAPAAPGRAYVRGER
ncbi:hypothetical protein DAETH_24860 [Deinococcus aetherius]|uniref:Uncharacterized protein n=1 Tax=Deinococcus aetherius TaxID=200252 RepID=A0ABM8AFG6_9DEIO|nr:hypothetical protein [Deinococcus aetherius]BDP42517.1 hypothetical protein DAETH_24860 [Deinococcus aetherius]